MQHTDKYSQHSSIIWPVWLNGSVLVYKLSGCGLQSRCHIGCTGNQLKTVQKNHPQITTPYAKSDNKECYQKLLGPEALLRLCQ